MNIIQVYKRFPTQEDCIFFLQGKRWGNEPICPYCGSKNHSIIKGYRFHCNGCNTHYSVTVDTIFHDTKLDLQKWFLAISLILNAKKGLSSRQLARDIEVNKDTAWRMQMQIRKAMVEEMEMFDGICEADETYIGGQEKNKHKDKKQKGTQGRSTKTKQPVIGIANRGGKIRAKKAKDVKGKTLKGFINENVEKGTAVVTDEWSAYRGLSKNFDHFVIKHNQGEYARGDVHTNTVESFWALLKRGITGQYHHVTVRYLDRYIDEFCFKFNNREGDVFGHVIENGLKRAA